MELIDLTFPLIAVIGPTVWTERAVAEMDALYEQVFKRGERYAVISHSPKDATLPGAHERKLITAWAGSPRIKKMSAELCVGSATVVPSALARGALTAILWVWTPPSPMKSVATPDEAFDWCWDRLAAFGVPIKGTREQVRERLVPLLRNA